MCVVYTATEDRINVLIVWKCLRQTVKCDVMYVFTLVQSHTHVDTVQTVLCGLANWSDIYWSHTMKALGSLVTFVRRNSAAVIPLRYTYSDMKVWSRMFVVNVQSVSIHHLIWNVISWYTRTPEALPAVYVLKVSSINKPLWNTLRDVPLASVLVIHFIFSRTLLR